MLQKGTWFRNGVSLDWFHRPCVLIDVLALSNPELRTFFYIMDPSSLDERTPIYRFFSIQHLQGLTQLTILFVKLTLYDVLFDNSNT
mmetsp:Transcript_3792/g.8040  ORF Transcript_3792/g.8040 Transcript_3792/m.8040 type:complete len:87 (-) Transcript_3792:12-272(-)